MKLQDKQLKDFQLSDKIIDSDTINNVLKHIDISEEGGLSVISLSTDSAKLQTLSVTGTFGENQQQGILYTNKICGIEYNKDGTERSEYANSIGLRSIAIGAKNIGTGYDQAIFGQANVLQCAESIAAGFGLSALNRSNGQGTALFGLSNTVEQCQGSLVCGTNNILSTKSYTSFVCGEKNVAGKDSPNVVMMNQGNRIDDDCGMSIVGGRYARVKDKISFVWNGAYEYPGAYDKDHDRYTSHGNGSFNINPKLQSRGFYINEMSLRELIQREIYEAAVAGISIVIPYYICNSTNKTIREEVTFKDGETFKDGVTYCFKTGIGESGSDYTFVFPNTLDPIPTEQYYRTEQYNGEIDPESYYYVSTSSSSTPQVFEYKKGSDIKAGTTVYNKIAQPVPLVKFTDNYYYLLDPSTHNLNKVKISNLFPKKATLKISF